MARLGIIRQMSRQVSHGSDGEYQADEQEVSRGSKETNKNKNIFSMESKCLKCMEPS